LIVSFVAAVVVPTAVVAPSAGAAGDIVVTTTADVVDAGDGVLSLREAVAQANATAGEDTVVLAEDATYQLTRCGAEETHAQLEVARRDLDVTDPAGLLLEGHGSIIEQTCDSALFGVLVPVVTVAAGGTAHIGHLSLSAPDLAVALDDASLDVVGVTITGTDGVRLWGSVDLTVESSSIADASAGVITEVPASDGSSRVAVVDSSVTGAAGAVDLEGGDVTVTGSVLENNGFAVQGTGVVEVLDSSVSENEYGIIGAAELRIRGSVLDENQQAAIFLLPSGSDPEVDVEVRSSSLSGNENALEVRGGEVRIYDSEVRGNEQAGLALLDRTDADLPDLVVERSTISENARGIETTGEVVLQQTTVSGNWRTGIESSYLHADRSTIAGNARDPDDAYHEVDAGQLAATGSIIGDGRDREPECSIDEVILSSFTLYGDVACLDGATPPAVPPAGDLVGVDPLLGPLGDNGGPTDTRLPGFLSPALDAAGGCSGTDQRGVVRPQGTACDMGAVEREAVPRFSDVPVVHQFFWEVECLVDLGVTEGFSDGTFRPSSSISRQGVVAWLWRLAGEPAPAGSSPFSDVPASHQFHDAIVWAAEEGVATGFDDGTFRPATLVSRQGVAAWLWRLDGEPDVVDPPTFSDVPVGSLFEEPIAWLASSGVTEGFADGTFRPKLPISRQGLAAWICRYDERESG
jgi:hypothetical protein